MLLERQQPVVYYCLGLAKNRVLIEKLALALADARARLTIPLIASGGAGSMGDFLDVFNKADVSGALAASVFHTGAIAIPDLKASLAASGLEVRQ